MPPMAAPPSFTNISYEEVERRRILSRRGKRGKLAISPRDVLGASFVAAKRTLVPANGRGFSAKRLQGAALRMAAEVILGVDRGW